MNDLLSIGASGVAAYRTALTAIGDNVANSETPGYARRDVRLRELSNEGSRSVVFQEENMFSGVHVAEVGRAWDAFRAADARLASSAAERAGARTQWLTSIETVLDDGPAGVGQLISGFFASATTLSAAPKDLAQRSAMLAKLEQFTGAVRSAADGLDRISRSIGEMAELEAAAVNADLATLAKVNTAILQSADGRSSRASLEDQRDRLVDSISKRVDVTLSLDSHGRAILTMARATGVTLLDPTQHAIVKVTHALDGRLSLELEAGGTRVPLPAIGGSLSGLAEVAATTADRRSQLETIVSSFATDLNNWSQAGVDYNGAPGAPLLDLAGGAISLRLLTSDPASIAAGSPGSDNGNLLALDTLRGAGGIENRWGGLIAAQAHALAAARSEASLTQTRRDNAYAALDEITGIDLDREAAELMRYQQAYNGSTKVIQVARETMQSILELF